MPKPSKPFLFCLALVAATGATVLANAPVAQAAPAGAESMPLSTKLTPAMMDFFALDVAYEHPSMTALAACAANPACGQSDTSRVRILDASGQPVAVWDTSPSTVIEQERHLQLSLSEGRTQTRIEVRRYHTDAQGHVVMDGRDSIVTVTSAEGTRPASRLLRMHRYSDVRYMQNDLHLVYPLTGLVLLELTTDANSAPAGHAAVSYDGTSTAHIITSGALLHTVDLQARRLDTQIPDR